MTAHIMVDLETLGTHSNSPIIAIGATDGVRSFYGKIKLKNIEGAIDPSTMEWWLQQSPEAVNETFFNEDNIKASFHFLLIEFGSWLGSVIAESEGEYKIYGNGADFDLVMLKEAYGKQGLEIPWNFRKQMCYRTLKNQFHTISADDITGTKHTALADAQYQHAHLIKILAHIEDMEACYRDNQF